MRKRLQIFCLLLLPCLTLMGILGRGSPAALSTSSNAAIPASADNWGLSFPAEHETPIGNATADFLTQYDAWYVGDTSQKVIYLTFDCGYENGNTEAILDALKKHSAPAAFFVVGHMIESAPDIVRRMAAEGHIVGNHTYHHPDMSAISDKASFQKELDSLAALYQEITGQELSHFYRPPQGKYSEQNLKLAQELGYQTVFWSLAYVDWYADNQPTAEQAYAKLLPRIHNGAIVLLHSTSSTNAAILDELLTKYEEMEKDTTLAKDQKLMNIQKELDEATALELPTLEQNLVVIATMTTLGTLTGLLGTVIGMIKSFAALANAGSPDSVALSAGISEALVNTAFGIATGALAVISYNYFTSKIDKLTYSIDEVGFTIVQTYAATHK